MKRIVSVSIGSSARDKRVEAEILGEKFTIERIGTDGDIKKAIGIIKQLDGEVDAFGMGGIDLYLTSGSGRKHVIREAKPIIAAARKTPIADGTGIKMTLEKKVIEYLRDNKIIPLKGKKVLVTCAADRYYMAKGFTESGCQVAVGDLAFALGIPLLIRNLVFFRVLASIAVPLISKLPFKILYPTGEKQEETDPVKYARFYHEADIIAGDYHYIKKYMPLDMIGKVVVTNTVTEEDVKFLKDRGVSTLITTTPEFSGRSFGTNVIEAILLIVSGKTVDQLKDEDYYELLDKLAFKPRIERLNQV